jgi:hypothetical protein
MTAAATAVRKAATSAVSKKPWLQQAQLAASSSAFVVNRVLEKYRSIEMSVQKVECSEISVYQNAMLQL